MDMGLDSQSSRQDRQALTQDFAEGGSDQHFWLATPSFALRKNVIASNATHLPT